jgi:alkaline phosphatase
MSSSGESQVVILRISTSNAPFSGGAEQFCPPSLGGETYMDLNYYNVFADAGYTIVANNTELQAASDTDRLLGIFSISNMAKWYDTSQNEYKTAVNSIAGSIGTSTPITSMVTRIYLIVPAAMPSISPA